jgi:hypothetical protein
METSAKSLAFLCAYVALASSVTTGWSTPRAVRRVELVLVGIATLGLLAAIGDRLLEREVIAMVFVCFNNLAHLALLLSLLTSGGPGRLLTAFALLMICGELVKIGFLYSTGFTVRNNPTSTLISAPSQCERVAFSVLTGRAVAPLGPSVALMEFTTPGHRRVLRFASRIVAAAVDPCR